jgi:hypothetical protein
MANIFYKQCFLQKKTGSKPEVITQQVAWIPEVFAHQGQYVEIKGDNGWQVTAVSPTRVPEDQLNDFSKDFKNQRKASDVATIPTRIRAI